MRFLDCDIEFTAQAGAHAPLWHGVVDNAEQLTFLAVAVRQNQGRLVAIWGSQSSSDGGNHQLNLIFAISQGHLRVKMILPDNKLLAPDLSGIFASANRMQRACQDLSGIRFDGEDQRPWLQHGCWSKDWQPLAHNAGQPPKADLPAQDYDFIKVRGDSAHEIAVGPIHAGIIEPGHFRFSVAGERILLLEQRLGYTHRGIEKLFQGQSIDFGARLAGRICGDSTCAYAWAYAAAIEAATATTVPQAALNMRGLILERERIANHLGDLGALGNDAAFAFGLSQFSSLREDWLRLNQELCGHRLMMDTIVPGGVSKMQYSAALHHKILNQLDEVGKEVGKLHTIYQEHAGMQDRFVTTGRINMQQVQDFSLTGIAARACGALIDGRCAQQGYIPYQPYTNLDVRLISDNRGDVAARAEVRFGEIDESLRLLRALAKRLLKDHTHLHQPISATSSEGGEGGKDAEGIGIIEGWRGEVVVYAQYDDQGMLTRVHPHDPSWQIWPALELSVLQDIVPDFPLINKSFNLAYAGNDL